MTPALRMSMSTFSPVFRCCSAKSFTFLRSARSSWRTSMLPLSSGAFLWQTQKQMELWDDNVYSMTCLHSLGIIVQSTSHPRPGI
jgi:hypothetical protein